MADAEKTSVTLGLLILLAYVVLGIPSTLYIRFRGLPDPSHLEHEDNCYDYEWQESKAVRGARYKKHTELLCKNDRRIGHCKLQLWEWVANTLAWPMVVGFIVVEWIFLMMEFIFHSINPFLQLVHKALTVRF